MCIELADDSAVGERKVDFVDNLSLERKLHLRNSEKGTELKVKE